MAFDAASCPLCLAIANEDAIYKDDKVTILETNNLKGHQRRIMVVWNIHNDLTWRSRDMDYMIGKMSEIGREVFNYTSKFVIMSTKFASIRDHIHYVATDLDTDSDDFLQIMGTPWVEVVHLRDWDKRNDAQ